MTFKEILVLIKDIAFIGVIVCSTALVIFVTVKAYKEKVITRQRFTLYIVALAAILTAYLAYNVYEITPADWAQILLMLGLVTATGFYAWRTHAMSEEMREQRLSEARPYLLLRLEGDVIQWDKGEDGKLSDRDFPITIRNVGKGPAINLWASLWSPEEDYFGDSKGYLAPEEEWQVTISRAAIDLVTAGIIKEKWLPELKKSIKKKYPGVIAVKYNDVHHRTWVSYLCLERHDVEAFVMEGEQNILELKNGN
ncbi:MAG: hypothetical protein PVJ08_05510 [Dehalococcoidia bacterium]